MRLGAVLTFCLLASAAHAERARATPGSRLRVVALEPSALAPARGGAATANEERIASLKKQVDAEPKKRELRFELVTALQRAGKLEQALDQARAWRQVDAYNLVVVRLIGDLLSEQGKPNEALRVYSAVVELLADDPDAQRALATVLKQSSQLEAARQRLQAAHQLRPDDSRITFELADVIQRIGDHEEAKRLLTEVSSSDKTPNQIAYPARQRLGQLLAAELRLASADGGAEGGKAAEVEALTKAIADLKISGGVNNDIKIYLTWDTNRTDVDLWVTTPSGETISYKNKQGKFGGALFDDVTDGYGPESFTAKRAQVGTYKVQVNFFGTSRETFRDARGELTIIVDEGSPAEQRHVLPYRLQNPKQTVSVANIEVGSAPAPLAPKGGA